METVELRGGELASSLREEIKRDAEALKARGITPRLVAVSVGADPSILSYIEMKSRAAGKLGILLESVSLPEGTSEAELEAKIKVLSAEPAVHGILLELPLPLSLSPDRVIACIPRLKDVDGLTSENLGLAMVGREEEAILSATAQACIMLAETLEPLRGKYVAVVGKGRTVGKPIIPLLLNRGATVTVCHSATADLKTALANASIIFSGVGKPGVLNAGVIRPGQTIIDAGTVVAGGKLSGDTSLDVWGIAGAVTPVPEGVGPLTTALVFKNLLKAIKLQGI